MLVAADANATRDALARRPLLLARARPPAGHATAPRTARAIQPARPYRFSPSFTAFFPSGSRRFSASPSAPAGDDANPVGGYHFSCSCT